MVSIKEVWKNVYQIEEDEYKEHCNCYLVVGSKKCLLIDLGVGSIDFTMLLKDFIRGKELVVTLTHFHFDHFGGASFFNNILANKCDLNGKDIGFKYLKGFDKKDLVIDVNKFKHVENGYNIDLGDYSFEVVYTPGHDKTSICFVEFEKGMVFSGDLLYDGNLLYDFSDSDEEEYYNSLKKLLAINPKVIFGGHNNPIKENINLAIISAMKKFI